MMTMMFKEWDCIINPSMYSNGRKAICLTENGPLREPIAVATVNLPDNYCPDDHIFVKNYSENEGMTSALHTAGIIELNAVKMVDSGHVTVGLHKLTEKGLNLFK